MKTWNGVERRSTLTVSGPWGLKVVIVGAWAIIWALVGLIGGFSVCLWVPRP